MPGKVAAFMAVSCEIKDYKFLQKKVAAMKAAPQKVMKSVTNDAKKRAPSWVAAEVAKEYGMKKGEITGQKVGKVKAEGTNIKNVRIVYTGRLLTPARFGMSPKAPNPGGAYTLKATIVKGQRATLGKVKKLTKKQRKDLGKNFTRTGTQTSTHSPIMLMHTGNTREGGTDYIPFQRKSVKRTDLAAIKTLSLPQMVSSDRTKVGIQRAINEGLAKRLDHYLKRYME